MDNKIQKTKIPRSTDPGLLRFGDVVIECHVLDDGTRLITQRGVLRGLGASEDQPFGRFVERIPNAADGFKVQPIAFRTKGKGSGGIGHGVTAEMFVRLVTLYVQASDEGLLHESQEHIADRCRQIGYALMGVGITALIDEATGYQKRRKHDALDEKLRAYLLPEKTEWELHFPEELYYAFARVYRIEYHGGSAPRWGASLVRKYVYEAIDPDVARELKRICPKPQKDNNWHQHLSERAKMVLDEHIRRLLVVLRGATSVADFKMRFDHEFRGTGLQLSFG
jgi:hypothetical protein